MKISFGSSGIRGLANIEITPNLAQRLGSTIATINDGGYTLVGRDVRVTGPMLEYALISGINSCGGDVGLVNVLPTPIIAWLTKKLDADNGIAITASHNPSEYNGFKIFNNKGMSLTKNERKKVQNIINSHKFRSCSWDEIGKVENLDVSGMYLDNLLDSIDIARSWKVACDLFYGSTASVAKKIFDCFNSKTVFLNSNPDGYFPAGKPEPSQENLLRLGQLVKKTEADIGFGFDGDGDRVMVVDEKGIPINGDRLLAAYANHVIEKNGGGIIVTHIGSSMSIEDMVEPINGKVIRVKVGDSFISEEMVTSGAVFGGEPIGAWILPEINMCPDGILSALKLMEALEDKDIKISKFIEKIPEYPNQSLSIQTENKSKLMQYVLKNYEKLFNNIIKVNTMDGLRLEFDEGWVLIRASGTEPLIRITIECRNNKNLENLMKKSITIIKNIEEII
ncbi:phosphoglucosamine mutase [Candidatus Bathyarchaeota archaeon]|nr:phosphoglucosamine mutase [Candidatus Bathyarchaeota archaeon]